MARGSAGNCQLAAVCVCMLLACISSTPLLNAEEWRPLTLVLYEHEIRTGPGKTAITSGGPSGNLTTYQFGTIIIVSNILRVGNSNTSTQVGKVVGMASLLNDLSVYSSVAFELNTTSYAGTLFIQSVLTSSYSGESVITGGARDFRWVRGYVETFLSSTNPEGIVFHHTVHLKYD